jgi:hypothetical protein
MCTDDMTMHAKAKSIEVERVLELTRISHKKSVLAYGAFQRVETERMGCGVE